MRVDRVPKAKFSCVRRCGSIRRYTLRHAYNNGKNGCLLAKTPVFWGFGRMSGAYCDVRRFEGLAKPLQFIAELRNRPRHSNFWGKRIDREYGGREPPVCAFQHFPDAHMWSKPSSYSNHNIRESTGKMAVFSQKASVVFGIRKVTNRVLARFGVSRG